MKKNGALLLIFITIIFKTKADVKPNSLFSDNMVLQCGTNVPVWGKADEDEEVTVSFCGQKVRTKAKEGKWFVKLKPLKPGGPFEMTITGKNSITIKNVLVGEVWICSGQSNIEMVLSKAWPLHVTNWEQEIAAANYPSIRQFNVPKKPSFTPLNDVNGEWKVCDTNNVKNFSAVAYFFARELYNHSHVPIGLLYSTWGGTPAERWTPKEVFEADTSFYKLVEHYEKSIKEYPALSAKYKAEEKDLLAKWKTDSTEAAATQKLVPKKPSPPSNPLFTNGGVLYNGMIAPLIPYAIKGVIWYQGESDRDKAEQYKRLFPLMINAWRTNFGQGQFPFLYAMVAPWMNMNPTIREAQTLTLSKIANTAMISTIDCGDSLYIHPPNKQPVGARFAIAARAIAYKEKIEYAGPMFKSFKIVDNAIEIAYTHVGKGLECKHGDLIGFSIAGENKNFVPAKAFIKGDKVIVSHPDILKPLFVRFGWANVPRTNLYNKDGLPAVPFRTDTD